VSYVATGSGVFLLNLCQLLGRETRREPNERWPEPTMNQRDLAIDETANEHLLGIGDGLKDCEDVMALRVRPPTALDWLADDGLCEARDRSFGRHQDNAVFPDEGQCLLSSGALAHDA
jgi:hypothetical protein